MLHIHMTYSITRIQEVSHMCFHSVRLMLSVIQSCDWTLEVFVCAVYRGYELIEPRGIAITEIGFGWRGRDIGQRRALFALQENRIDICGRVNERWWFGTTLVRLSIFVGHAVSRYGKQLLLANNRCNNKTTTKSISNNGLHLGRFARCINNILCYFME